MTSCHLQMLATRVQQALRAPLSSYRGLATCGVLGARGRARYIKGGSNRQDLGPEARELLAKARDMDDLSWQVGLTGFVKRSFLDLF